MKIVLVFTHTESYSTWESLQTETFSLTKRSILFTMSDVITIADMRDGIQLFYISNDIFLEKLHVHNNLISGWFTIKTVVRNVYGHFLKHLNGNSNVCNVLALTDLHVYTPNGKLIKPTKLKSK